ncbi:hypothetical protein KY362_07155 [Candidatus Woesearchaeota archaeon]|nr:hypothetical protein [Candidatus Woesearchaeota archaeon]
MKSKVFTILISSLVLLLLIPAASADLLLSNSKDWQDVYTVLMYGGITKTNAKFLVSDRHGPIMVQTINPDENIEIFSSKKRPCVVGYESMMRSGGRNNVKGEEYSDMNLELIERLPDVTDFVIIDDAYGYNALAVAPYAVMTQSYVLFANSDNIGDVMDVLESRDVGHVIIYGHVDRRVREQLEKYDPEIINKDGDRFANNVEIVKKYREINPARQIIMSNGEFIEMEMLSGVEPLLFIGRENVPDQIKDYIKSTDIEVGVLIGNELVGTATIVRRQVGISTFVKFAQSARAAAGTISQVEGLDRFPVPKVELNLEIVSVKYNKLTGMLQITFKNSADIVSYFKGTYTLTANGQEFVIGDEEPVFIDRNDLLTVLYPVEGLVPDGEMTLKAYVIYGESKNSLEFIIDETYSVSTTDVSDEAELTIEKLQYDKTKHEFLIHLKNIGEVDAYANSELVDIVILDSKTTLGSEETVFIEKGKTGVSVIKAELSDEDLEANPTVHVRVRYGEREDALIKVLEGDFEILIKSFDMWTYVPIAVIALLVLLILFGRKKCRSCGHKNPRSRKHCKKCKHPLK